MIREERDTRRDRLAGGLQGLLIGDALGVPYEFHDAVDLPPREAIDFDPPPSFTRAHPSVPPGTWSDDGAQALCLLASLLAQGGLDLGDFSRRLLNWHDWGYLAVDGQVFDVGVQTARALASLRDGVAPDRAGPAGDRDNGNGSLMRVLPLALWHRGDDAYLVAMAARQSLPTHGHVRSAIACAMLCLWARAELHGDAQPWAHAEHVLRSLAPDAGFPPDEVDRVLDPAQRDRAGGTGYVIDSLWSARVAVETTSSYADCVRAAIGFGQDTDTTAAIAGGMAGVRHGLTGIPPDWREQLRGKDLFADIQAALLEHAGAG